MKIIALSALFAGKVPEWVADGTIRIPYIMIRVTGPGVEFTEIPDTELSRGVTKLKFHDLDKKLGEEKYDKFLFTENDADQILDFVESHPEAELIIVHCDGGVSRSAGIAAALSKILTGSDFNIFNSKRYQPNMHVYRTILNRWHSRNVQ